MKPETQELRDLLELLNQGAPAASHRLLKTMIDVVVDQQVVAMATIKPTRVIANPSPGQII